MSLSIKISIIIIILSLFPDIGSSPVFAFKNGFLLKNQQRQMQRQIQRQRQQQMRRQQQMQRQRQQQAQRQRTLRNKQLQTQRRIKRQQLQRNKRLQAQRKLQRQRQLRQQRARTQKQRRTRNLQKYALLRNPLTANRIASRGINKRVRWRNNKHLKTRFSAQKNQRIRERQAKDRRQRQKETEKRKREQAFIQVMGKKSLVAIRGGNKSFFKGASGTKHVRNLRNVSSVKVGEKQLKKRVESLKKSVSNDNKRLRLAVSRGKISVKDANFRHVKNGNNPPYANKSVRDIVLKNKKVFVRVHGNKNQARSWMMRERDIKGLTAKQIQNKFALPEKPKFVSKVHVPAGTNMRTGIVKQQKGWGTGGGRQYELLNKLPKNMYKDKKPLS